MQSTFAKSLGLFLIMVFSSSGFAFPEAQNGWWLEKPTGQIHELVLAEGLQLTAKTRLGTLVVTAGPQYTRYYEWDGGQCRRSVEQWPRTERWYGSYGIYFPGPGNHWQECHGISRAVVEEGQMHFASAENALKWLQWQATFCSNAAATLCAVLYSQDGLFVAFDKVLTRAQLGVRVFQIYINGKKPMGLQGATDQLVIGPSAL